MVHLCHQGTDGYIYIKWATRPPALPASWEPKRSTSVLLTILMNVAENVVDFHYVVYTLSTSVSTCLKFWTPTPSLIWAHTCTVAGLSCLAFCTISCWWYEPEVKYSTHPKACWQPAMTHHPIHSMHLHKAATKLFQKNAAAPHKCRLRAASGVASRNPTANPSEEHLSYWHLSLGITWLSFHNESIN